VSSQHRRRIHLWTGEEEEEERREGLSGMIRW
jgi:hypothetical protein